MTHGRPYGIHFTRRTGKRGQLDRGPARNRHTRAGEETDTDHGPACNRAHHKPGTSVQTSLYNQSQRVYNALIFTPYPPSNCDTTLRSIWNSPHRTPFGPLSLVQGRCLIATVVHLYMYHTHNRNFLSQSLLSSFTTSLSAFP